MTRLSAAEYRAAVSEPRPSKYRSKRAYRCVSCGAAAERHKCSACGASGKKATLMFDSGGEARRWDELCRLQRLGLIEDLRRQVRVELTVNDRKLGYHVVDFTYTAGGVTRWEEFKGFDHDLGKWKRAHAEAQYGIRIEVVK